MKPPFDLNRMSVLRMVSILSRNNGEANIFPVVLKDTIRGSEEEIKKVMDELVSIGLLTKEDMSNLEEEFGTEFVEHYGQTAYKLASKDFFVMGGAEILREGINLEEKGELDAAETLYNILLARDENDYHALFCLSRLKRKKGIFESGLINSAIKEAKNQKASGDVLKVMNEELRMILPMLQNNDSNKEPELKFGEQRGYNFKISYTENKTSTARVKGNDIILNISKLMPEEYQIKAIDSLKRRMMDRIKKGTVNDMAEETEKELKGFNDGDKIKVGNDEYSLKIFFEDKKSSSATLDGNTIRMRVSANLPEEKKKLHINELIRMMISHDRLPKLEKSVNELNKKHFNVKINGIKFKKQTSRWGSCSSNRNINISYRLLFAPEHILEYVCVHELAHLIEPNHSERFWRLIEGAVPDYSNKIEWLKKYGGGLGL